MWRNLLPSLRGFAVSLMAVILCLIISIAALSLLGFGRETDDSFSTGIIRIARIVWTQSILPGNHDRNWFESLTTATPILLTGLCAAVAFRASALNIGGEGQYVAGAIAATIVALHGPSSLTLILLTAAIAGALWAGIAALLDVWRRVPVVLSTLLLNFVAVTLVKSLLQGPLHEEGQALQSEQFPDGARLPHLIYDGIHTRLHWGLFIAIAAALGLAFILRCTVFGFRLRATGENPVAARFAGIATDRVTFLTLALSGSFAGLAGGIQMSGVPPFQLLPDTGSSGFGFTGIAVALLGRLSPGGVILAAIFFGWLNTAFARLQTTLHVDVLAAQAAQGMILITMLIFSSTRLWHRRFLWRKKRATV